MLSFTIISALSRRGSAAGAAVALGVGADASGGAAIGASNGISTVLGVAGPVAAIGLAVAISTATAFGADGTPGATVGAGAGVATAAAIGRATAGGNGVAAGVGSVAGHGAGPASSIGAAAGLATVSGVNAGTRGICAGLATVAGVGSAAGASVGASAGSSSVAGAAMGIAASVGAAAGTAAASAVGDVFSVTTWSDVAVTGRGADIAITNAGLTAAGKSLTLGIAIDLDNKRMWGRVGNGVWSGASGNPATNTGGFDISSIGSVACFIAFSAFNGDATTANTGATQFERDVPSGFSAWGGAFDSANKDASITLSNGDLTATGTASSAWKSVRGTSSHTTGKYYFEMSADNVTGGNGWFAGIENASGSLSSYLGSTANGAGFQCTTAAYANGTFTNSVLTVAVTKFSAAWRTVRSVGTTHTSGKWYAEITCDAHTGASGWMGGVCNGAGVLQNFLGSTANGASFDAAGIFRINNTAPGSNLSTTLSATKVLCLSIDLDHNMIWGRVDGGAWSGAGNPATNSAGNTIATVNDAVAVYLAFAAFDTSPTFDKATLNVGATTFTQTVPSGFSAWG